MIFIFLKWKLKLFSSYALVNNSLGYFAPPGEKLAQGKTYDRAPVPILLQLTSQLTGDFVEGRQMLILEFYRNFNQPVFMLGVAVMIAMMSAVVAMIVMLILLIAHKQPPETWTRSTMGAPR
jgi:hypothetical protein